MRRKGSVERIGLLLLALATFSASADEEAYPVQVDPGVSCRMRPEEVARAANGDGKITSMRCTTLNREHNGQPIDDAVWWVSYGDQSFCADDASGKIIGVSGKGFPTTARPPPPEQTQIPH